MARSLVRSLALLVLLSGTDALAAGGDVDRSFGDGGVALLGKRQSGPGPGDVQVLADGRLVLAAVGRVYRLLPDGMPDPTFGHRGAAQRLRVLVERLGVQPDGGIVVSGWSRGPLLIMRLGPDGRLDRTFGRHGSVRIDERRGSYPQKIAIDAQGRILVFALDIADGCLVRLLADGARDPSFGTDGIAVDRQLAGGGYSALAIQADGRILATVNGSLVRLLDDGRRDPTFGYLGSGTIALGTPGKGHRSAAVFPLDDGRTLTAGTVVPWPYSGYDGISIGRLLPDGTADSSFGAFGYVHVEVGTYSQGESAARLSDGRIVVAGVGTRADLPWSPPDTDYFVARFLPDGTPDPSFGVGGVVLGDLVSQARGTPMDDVARTVAVQPDGAIVAGIDVYDPARVEAKSNRLWDYVVRLRGD